VHLPNAESHLFQDLIGTAVTMTLMSSAKSGGDFLAAPKPSVGLTCVQVSHTKDITTHFSEPASK